VGSTRTTLDVNLQFRRTVDTKLLQRSEDKGGVHV